MPATIVRHRPAAAPALVPPRLAFPGTDLITASAALFTDRAPWRSESYAAEKALETMLGAEPVWRRRGDVGPEGRSFRIQISAGTVGVALTDPARRERNHADVTGTYRSARPGYVVDTSHRTGCDRSAHGRCEPECTYGQPIVMAADDADWCGRLTFHESEPTRQVEGWSRKSRARMVRRLAQLDWSPMYAEGRPSVMVTLTYPGDWLTVAPSGREVKRHFRLFQLRYKRRWKVPLMCAWKLEFQARGAPHLHLLVVPPADPTFRHWLSATWAAIVAHPDPEQRRLHEAAGTRVDYVRGKRCFDPKRAAVYFSKHGGAGGGKEYQHRVPEEWREPGKGPGRFWGYLGLKPVVAEVELPVRDYLTVRRTMRRWSRANGLTRTATVDRVDTRTGVIRQRRTTRRLVYLARSGLQGGTLVVNDGPAFASALARALDVIKT